MLKKLFIAILLFTSVSCGQSWWWQESSVFIAPRSLNAEGDSFKINLTIPDFVSGDTLKLYYNGSLIETFFEDTTTVLGLTHNTQYCYELKRQTFQGLSAGSFDCATTVDTTDRTAPASISNFALSVLSPSSLTATWTKPEAGNISIWLKVFGSTDSSEVYYGNAETTVISDLQPSTNYQGIGIFYDWNLNYSVSNQDTGLTLANNPALSGGDDLNATTLGVTSIGLTWRRVLGGVGDTITYKVYGSLNNFADSLLLTTQYNDTDYTHTGLERNTEWYYRVHSTDSSMNALATNMDSATTDNDVTPPAVPTSLAANGVSTSQINLTWVNSDGARGYIYRSPTAGGTYVKIDSFSLGATTYQNSGLPSSTAYWYTVSTVDEWWNESSQSTADSGLTLTPVEGELSIPLNLSATGNTSNDIVLDWDNVTNATGYEIWGQSDRYFKYAHKYTLIGTSATSTYTHQNIPDGWEWNYYVKAYNDTDTSGISSIETSFPLRSTGQNRYVSRYGNGATFSNSTPTSAMSLSTLVSNLGSLTAGDSVYFFADSVIAPSSISGDALIDPSGQVVNGDSLAYIVFCKYGTGADPILSAANAATGKYAISTYGNLFQYVIWQDIDFYRPIEIRASTGHNHHIQFRRCYLNASGGGSDGGLWFYVNPASEPEPMEWTFEGGSRQYAIEIADCYIENAPTDGLNKTGGLFSARNDTTLSRGHDLGDWIHGNKIFNSGQDNLDWQGSGIVIENNIVNDAISSGIKITPHYNGGKNNIVRGNICLNADAAGGLSLSNETNLLCYNNTVQDPIFGNQAWNPPTSQRNDSNFVFNNILFGIEYVKNYQSIEFTHVLGGTSTFTDDSLHVNNYFWHNIRNRNGSYAIMDIYYHFDETAEWSGGAIIEYDYTGTEQRDEVSEGNFYAKWGSKYPNVIKDSIITPVGVTNISVVDNDRADTILARMSLLAGAYAIDNGYDTTFTDFPYTRDILGAAIPTTNVDIGALQYLSCSVTDHFTYSGIPYSNNDFLVQRDGYKTLTITGHNAVTTYDSVALHVLKNGVLFMRDADVLSYDACDSTSFSVTLNVPADTVEYTYRFYRNTTVLDSASGIRIGNAYLVSGQSNAIQDVTGYKDSLANQLVESEWIETYVGWKGKVNGLDALWDWGDIGTSWAILADSLVKKRAIPVLILNNAVGGTSITQHLGGDALYTTLISNVQALNQHINGWTRFYWIQGETEPDENFEEYAEYFDSLKTLVETNAGVDTTVVGQLGMHSCLYMGGKTFEMQRQLKEAYNDTKIIGLAGYTAFNEDECHYQFSEYKNIGTWLYRKEFSNAYENPEVDSASYNSTDSTITVYFDQAITYIDTLAIDHDDYWIVDNDSLMVDSGYVDNSTTIKLRLKDNPATVTYLGYLRTYQYYTSGYYRYPFIRNANRIAAILFDSLSVRSYASGAPTLQLPANFTATHSGIYDTVSFNATVFYRTVDFDSIRIRGSVGSYPANQWAGTSFYAGTDTAAIQNDLFVNTDLDSAETWYFTLWIRNTNGTWSSTAKQDTAYFPGSASSGGGSYPYTADLIGLWDETEMSVSNWGDQSANNYDLVQSSSGSQPTLQTSALNGYNGLRFDGTNDYLTDNTGNPGTNTHSQPFTIYVVYKSITRNSGQESIIGWNSNGTIGFCSNADGVYTTSGAYGVGDIATTNDVAYVAKIVVNGASSELLVAGVDSASGDIGASTMNTIIVGQSIGWFAGYEAANCEVYHLSIHAGAHSDGLSGVIVAWLRNKYGL